LIAGKRICPICKSDKINLWMGGFTGTMYRCPDCGYVGPVSIETSEGIPEFSDGEDREEEPQDS
jgi:Zn ribbon nucleic-acid-binding protein